MQTAVQQTLDIPLRWTDLIAINSAPKSGLDAAVTNFKRVLVNADRQALKNNDVVPPRVAADVEDAFRDCNAKLHALESELTNGNDELGARIQSDLLPYLLLTNTAERWYSKPRGYAGDFLSIHEIYQNVPQRSQSHRFRAGSMFSEFTRGDCGAKSKTAPGAGDQRSISCEAGCKSARYESCLWSSGRNIRRVRESRRLVEVNVDADRRRSASSRICC